MKSAQINILGGIVLMLIGVLWLLEQVGAIGSAAFLPALIFAAVGAVFAYLFARSREFWWAAIPGSVFFGLAAVITATQLIGGGAGAAFLFLFMGAGFAAVYLREKGNWWALIPCGVMLTLAVIVALPQGLTGMTVPAVLFLGLALTFGLLSRVPVRNDGHTGLMKWPLIPAAVLAVLGVVFALQAMALLISVDFAIPAVMILAGVGLLVYGYQSRRDRQRQDHHSRPGLG